MQQPMTEGQLKFLRDLWRDREIPEAAAEPVARKLRNGATKREASELITWMQTLPRKRVNGAPSGRQHVPTPEELPAGRYAVENEDGELRFYNLWRGTRKPEYVKLYVAHGPDDSEVPFRSALSIMAKIIQAGPRECAVRYGREIGACSSCGLRLTNNLSRELGIGPVCGGRFYADAEEWKLVKAEARDAVRARGEDPDASYDDSPEADALATHEVRKGGPWGRELGYDPAERWGRDGIHA